MPRYLFCARGDGVAANSRELFETMPVPSAVRTMVAPAVIGQLIVLFYNMADTFFVGRTNDPLMVAGASLILPVFGITLSFAGLAGVGGGSLVSRLLGAGEHEEASRAANFSIYLAIALASFFSLLTFFFMEPLLAALGASDETFEHARGYAFCVIVLGAIPTVLSNTLAGLLRSVGEARRAAFGITMGGLLNVALDPLFMFVIFPRGREIIGAGAATFLSNCAACAYFFFFIAKLGRGSVLTLRRPGASFPSRASVGAIFKVGLPSAIATLLFDIDYMVIGRLMSAYGSVPLAAIGIVLKIERLPLNIGVGICQGMVPIVAYNFSSGDRPRMFDAIKFSLKIGLVCGISSMILYESFAPHIMKIFIGEAQTASIGSSFLRVRSVATTLMFLSFFTLYIFNAFGRGDVAFFLGVMRWIAFNIPMLFALDAIFGMFGIVWAQAAADSLTVALSIFVFLRQTKKMGLR